MSESENIINLKWKRPDSVEYPKVWHRFKARDLDSDQLVEYRIEDLLEPRAEDAYNHMKKYFLKDEPISYALKGYNDNDYYEDYVFAWKSMLAQKMPLVCYREGSNEIVGVNWIFVKHKDDELVDKVLAASKSPLTRSMYDILLLLYKEFDIFDFYGVDEYLSSYGLSVDKNYRGRGIGDQFMAARKTVCKEFGLKLTHTIFTSDYSSRNAENVGFQTNFAISYDDVMKIKPEYDLSNINSTKMAIKTVVY